MAKGADASEPVDSLLRRAADDERRLLKRERRAELEVVERRDRLAEEQGRLERAGARVERRRAELAEAETRLRERQAARAAGTDPRGAEEGDRQPPDASEPTPAAGRRHARTVSSNGKGGSSAPSA